MLGKYLICSANGAKDENDVDLMKIEWPEDIVGKAKIIRTKAESMTGYAESISQSFITGYFSVPGVFYL